MKVLVVGGGCYGTLHARRMLMAKDRGRYPFAELWVIDRLADPPARGVVGERPDVRWVQADWDAFLADYMDGPDCDEADQFVPAPLAPHLIFNWLVGALARELTGRTVESVPVSHSFEQPYARHGADGGFYFSFADWECPVSCTEPAICPAIRAPRTWEQADFLAEFASARPAIAGLASFRCAQLANGIGGVAIGELADARRRFAELARRSPDRALEFLVATVSACHGALGQIAIGPIAAR
jgi:hypothetical protein